MNSDETGWSDGLMRLLTITWPKTRHSADGQPLPVAPYEIELAQTDTGEPLLTVLGMTIEVDLRDAITATLTMLVDDHDLPLIERGVCEVIDEGGEPRTGVFKWLVTEMKIAS